MRFTIGHLRKNEQKSNDQSMLKLDHLESRGEFVELAEEDLKYVCGAAIGPGHKNPAGNKPPGQTPNPHPGK